MHPNIADVTEELRDRALKRTAETLRKVDEVRRALELPVEQLPVVFKIYGKCVLALLADERPDESTTQQKLMEHNVELTRVNAQLFDGTVRVLAQQNIGLHEELRLARNERDRLRAQNAELLGKLPESSELSSSEP